jgi:hypothetical protein
MDTEQKFDTITVDGDPHSGTASWQIDVAGSKTFTWSSDTSTTRGGFKLCPMPQASPSPSSGATPSTQSGSTPSPQGSTPSPQPEATGAPEHQDSESGSATPVVLGLAGIAGIAALWWFFSQHSTQQQGVSSSTGQQHESSCKSIDAIELVTNPLGTKTAKQGNPEFYQCWGTLSVDGRETVLNVALIVSKSISGTKKSEGKRCVKQTAHTSRHCDRCLEGAIKFGCVYGCSAHDCFKLHDNATNTWGKGVLHYCRVDCSKNHISAAQRQLDSCIGDSAEEVDADKLYSTCDPDMTLSSCTNRHTGSLVQMEFLKPKLMAADQRTVDSYIELAKPLQEGLAQVRELCSFDDAHPPGQGGASGFKAGAVQNPKQPDMTIRKLMVTCLKRAPALHAIAAAATVAGGCARSMASINIKTPHSMARKMQKGDCRDLCDILRASAVCKDGAGIVAAYNQVVAELAKTGGRVRTLENYFKDPIGGYMDICLQIELPSEPSGFVCELQLQLEPMKRFKDKYAHHAYAWSRLIKPTHALKEVTFIGQYRRGGKLCKGTLKGAELAGTKLTGDGELFEATGGRYKGQFEGGERCGQGESRSETGDRYVGQFQSDMHHGEGDQHYHCGDRYQGQWQNHKQHGKGKYSCAASGGTYDGQWQDGKKSGQGVEILPTSQYKGQFKNGVYHGRGERTYAGGTKCIDQYVNGECQY